MEKITIDYIREFSKCPVRHYLLQKNPTDEMIKQEAKKNVTKLFLRKLMSEMVCSEKYLIKKAKEYSKGIGTEEIIEQVLKMCKFFNKQDFDIKCISFPFNVTLLKDVQISGEIDIIKRTAFGNDILVYDFSPEPDTKHLLTDPTFLIYVIAFTNFFDKEVNTIEAYRFETAELVDISRNTQTMIDQMEELNDTLRKIKKKRVKPRVSLKCKKCPVKKECFYNQSKVEKEING